MAPDPVVIMTATTTALVAGCGKVLLDFYKTWKEGPPTQLRMANANLELVARARDEVIEDNMRLRQERLEQDQRHAAERAFWLADQARLRTDIENLEKKLQVEREQANARYDALLSQVRNLRDRTDQLKEDSP